MLPLSEYPRPQLKRDSYLSLNGYWDYQIITAQNKLKREGKILVPFSPESKLSEVNEILLPNETLIYKRSIDISSFENFRHILLHFEKVDQICALYINDIKAIENNNGYLPFEVDIKPFIKDYKEVNIRLEVKDFTDASYQLRGKQKLKRGGIFYTPSSGIYMPVWLEGVNENYIQKIKITPDIDKEIVNLIIYSKSENVEISLEGENLIVATNKLVSIKIKNLKLWTPETPYLYQFQVKSNDDVVSSYFAMRKFSILKDKKGISRLALNNKPLFMKGVLDQGYYMDSLLTPSKDEDYINDILAIKKMGFNVSRKHIKIESLRWYYYCDKLGLIVWQDFINGGGKVNLVKNFIFEKLNPHLSDKHYGFFNRKNKEGREQNEKIFYQIIEYLYNCPCIALWTIFNEGWGQFDSKRIYQNCLKIDNTRIYDHASGWFDQCISDVKSLHIYFKRVKMPKLNKVNNRSIILSECGGYSLKIDNHTFSNKEFGYKKMKNKEEFLSYYSSLVKEDIIDNIQKGLSAFIYTQLTDVEDELNGFITYDRKVNKVSFEEIKEINDKITLNEEL